MSSFAQILEDRIRAQAPRPRCAPFEDAIAAFESDVTRAALPETAYAGGAPQPMWSVELGVPYPCSLQDLKRAFRRAALRTHPDCGGSHEAFLRTQALFEQARIDLTKPQVVATRRVSPYAKPVASSVTMSAYA